MYVASAVALDRLNRSGMSMACHYMRGILLRFGVDPYGLMGQMDGFNPSTGRKGNDIPEFKPRKDYALLFDALELVVNSPCWIKCLIYGITDDEIIGLSEAIKGELVEDLKDWAIEELPANLAGTGSAFILAGLAAARGTVVMTQTGVNYTSLQD